MSGDVFDDFGLAESGVNNHQRLTNCSTRPLISPQVQEVRAWTITKGFTAPQAAGVIHTDFEKGFIRAEVIKYDEFVKYNGSEAAIKEAGKIGCRGQDHIVAGW